MTQSHQTLDEALSELQGNSLSSVEFVHDYLQLHFDGPVLCAYTPPTVECGDRTFRSGESGYRDALCHQIGRRIKLAGSDDQSVSLIFEDGATVSISLREEDYAGPEALQLSIDGERTWVV